MSAARLVTRSSPDAASYVSKTGFRCLAASENATGTSERTALLAAMMRRCRIPLFARGRAMESIVPRTTITMINSTIVKPRRARILWRGSPSVSFMCLSRNGLRIQRGVDHARPRAAALD